MGHKPTLLLLVGKYNVRSLNFIAFNNLRILLVTVGLMVAPPLNVLHSGLVLRILMAGAKKNLVAIDRYVSFF